MAYEPFDLLMSDLERGIGFQPVDRLGAYPTLTIVADMTSLTSPVVAKRWANQLRAVKFVTKGGADCVKWRGWNNPLFCSRAGLLLFSEQGFGFSCGTRFEISSTPDS